MDALTYRDKALSTLTADVGCYILADLDDVPVYVGQSVDGIRTRVRRHLTSARSDIIANRQIDVWEIAFVWAFPVPRGDIPDLESALFHRFDKMSPLMNGTVPAKMSGSTLWCEPSQKLQIMSDADISERRAPEVRLPRQALHFARLVDHYLVVKKSEQIARAMNAHFDRLALYHGQLQERA